MSFEGPNNNEEVGKKEEILSLGFEDLEGHPEYGEVLQEVALEILKTEDKEYFDREFTGELDEEGYLIRKDGKAFLKPSQATGPAGMEEVARLTKEKLIDSL